MRTLDNTTNAIEKGMNIRVVCGERKVEFNPVGIYVGVGVIHFKCNPAVCPDVGFCIGRNGRFVHLSIQNIKGEANDYGNKESLV